VGRLQRDLGTGATEHRDRGAADRQLNPRRGRREDEGAGLIGTIAGFTVFLTFLFFAVNLLFGLYATSVVTTTANEGARAVAGGGVDADDPGSTLAARRQAEASMRAALGGYGNEAVFDWSGSDAGQVRLRVRAPLPDLLFGIAERVGPDQVDRTVTVRIERPR
jgi:hypothetical protein